MHLLVLGYNRRSSNKRMAFPLHQVNNYYTRRPFVHFKINIGLRGKSNSFVQRKKQSYSQMIKKNRYIFLGESCIIFIYDVFKVIGNQA